MSLLLQIIGAGALIAIFIALRLLLERGRSPPAAGGCAFRACTADCERTGQGAGSETNARHY